MCGQAECGGQGIMACPDAAQLENDLWHTVQRADRAEADAMVLRERLDWSLHKRGQVEADNATLRAEVDRLAARVAEMEAALGLIADTGSWFINPETNAETWIVGCHPRCAAAEALVAPLGGREGDDGE